MLTPTTLSALRQVRAERNWQQFHNFKSQAISLSLEVAELLEHVQWAKDNEVEAAIKTPDGKVKNEVADEIADIAIYLSMLVHDLNLDLDAAVQRKLAINRERYPVEKAQGKSTKYDKL